MAPSGVGTSAAPARPDPGRAPLAPPAARTFYNVADALVPPPDEGGPGAGARDLLAEMVRLGIGPGDPAAWGALSRLLRVLEWLPVTTLRSRRGLSRLPRARRRTLLERWSGGAWLGPRLVELSGWVREAEARAAGEVGGPAQPPGSVAGR